MFIHLPNGVIHQIVIKCMPTYKNYVSNIGKVGVFMLVIERFDLYKDC